MSASRLRTAHPETGSRALPGVAVLTAISVIAGVAVQAVMAAVYGVDSRLDAFYIALLIVSYFPIVYQSAVADPVVPAYLLAKARPDFVESMFGLTLGSGAVAGVVLIGARQVLVRWSSPGFDASQASFASAMVAALVIVPAANAATSYLTAIAAANKRFVVARAAAVVVPVCQLVGMAVGARRFGIHALVWSTSLGWAASACVLWIVCDRPNPFRSSLRTLRGPAGVLLVHSGWPMLVTIAAGGLHAFLDRAMASRLGPGMVTQLAYAEKLNGVMVTVFLMPLTFVALPYLSEARGRAAFVNVFSANVRAALLIFVPIAAFTMAFAVPAVDVLLRRGSFSPEDARVVGYALKGYMVGIPFYAVAAITGRGFVAGGRTWVLAALAPFALLIKYALNHALIARLGITGLTLSTSIGYVIFCLVTTVALLGANSTAFAAEVLPTGVRAAAAAALAWSVSKAMFAPHYTAEADLSLRVAQLSAAGAMFMTIYGGTLYIFARLKPSVRPQKELT